MANDPNYGKPRILPGFRMIDGVFLARLFSRYAQGGISSMDGITATAGGTKAAAYPLTKTLNRISVCATDHDSVLLPFAVQGSRVVVRNGGAATLDIYALGTQTIDANATATPISLATLKATELVCFTAGQWRTLSLQA